MKEQQLPLKYLFTAIYKNGATYAQTPEDRSIKEPEKRSAYFDVDHNQLVAFVLKGNGHEYGVDLRDGHFEIDGLRFSFRHHENPDVDPMTVANGVELQNFRLVYFTTNLRKMQAQIRGGQMSNPQEVEHTRVFNFGWQAQDAKGKNYQEIMQLN